VEAAAPAAARTGEAVNKPKPLDALDARHLAESELGFSASTADGVPYAQLVAAAKELRDLRAFSRAYSDLSAAHNRVLYGLRMQALREAQERHKATRKGRKR
jgi:hypothetical protein